MGELKQLGCHEVVRAPGSGAMGVVRGAHSGDIKRLLAVYAVQRAEGAGSGDGESAVVDSRAAAENAMASSGGSALEKYIAEREMPDTIFEGRLARFVTVAVTGLYEPAMIAGEGDASVGMPAQVQSDVVLPAIKENNGVCVKSIGDGSLSYFESALDAVRAAARIQKEMDALNMSKRFMFPVLVRIGMDSGKCVVEEEGIHGDVVNAACRLEAVADAGGILMSEDTYNALPDKSEIYCRFVKQVMLKGRQEPCNAYKAFWNPREIELVRQGPDAPPRQGHAVPAGYSGMRLVWGLVALIGLVFLLTLSSKYFRSAQTTGSVHTITTGPITSTGGADAQR